MRCYGVTPSQLSLFFRVALVGSPRRIPERSPETGDPIRVGPTCFSSLCVQVMALGGVKADVTQKITRKERLVRAGERHRRCRDVAKQVRMHSMPEFRLRPPNHNLPHAISRERASLA